MHLDMEYLQTANALRIVGLYIMLQADGANQSFSNTFEAKCALKKLSDASEFHGSTERSVRLSAPFPAS